eukprot:TRINITY_DN58171_c0_g1_i1.p1 TRINITY_DN58171_c0_g1~~TRINITY_DN58171_c0_g1_i1.p1  ORF type:complete len:163 (+),score=35.27 TRINITY_DN58171_c0_g1_i1:144-632(+)
MCIRDRVSTQSTGVEQRHVNEPPAVSYRVYHPSARHQTQFRGGGMPFYIFHPLLYIYTKIGPRVISGVVNTVGVHGLIALPFATIATEKVCYDTFVAARGIDMYAEHDEAGYNGSGGKHGGYPSGGAGLGSLSLIDVASEEDRWIVGFLGDEPRKPSRDPAV